MCLSLQQPKVARALIKKLNVDVNRFAPYICCIDLLLAELVYGVIGTAF